MFAQWVEVKWVGEREGECRWEREGEREGEREEGRGGERERGNWLWLGEDEVGERESERLTARRLLLFSPDASLLCYPQLLDTASVE